MNQEFKDRVANLLIDARVNAVLAEVKKVPAREPVPLPVEPEPEPGSMQAMIRKKFPKVPPQLTPAAQERAHRRKHGGPPVSDSTINQDFMDRLINIIMEKKVGGPTGSTPETRPSLRVVTKRIAGEFRKQGRPGEKLGEKGAPSFRNPKGTEDEIIGVGKDTNKS